MMAYSLMNGMIILISCLLREEKWCWKLPNTLHNFNEWKNFVFFAENNWSDYLSENCDVCFVLLVQIFCTHSLWKCLLIEETDWRLRHQFQKASLIPASSARPHQNVNLILNLDTLLFLPFEWGTQRWSSTESASSETDQLTTIIFLQDYFRSVIGWSRGIVFLSLSTTCKFFSGGKKGNKK